MPAYVGFDLVSEIVDTESIQILLIPCVISDSYRCIPVNRLNDVFYSPPGCQRILPNQMHAYFPVLQKWKKGKQFVNRAYDPRLVPFGSPTWCSFVLSPTGGRVLRRKSRHAEGETGKIENIDQITTDAFCCCPQKNSRSCYCNDQVFCAPQLLIPLMCQ